jgi:fibronectin-binding autotransporter adhesin
VHETIAPSAPMAFGADSALYTMGTFRQTLGGLSSTNAFGIVTGTGNANNLTLNVTNGASYDYTGRLNISAFTKNGPGTQILSGTNNFNGYVAVSNGTLLVNGLVSNAVSTVTNTVTVYTGGTLGGTGTIYRTVIVTNGACLAPGNPAPGTLTVSNLYLFAGCTNQFHLGATNASDKVAVINSLALGGVISVTPTNGFGEYTYDLMTYTATPVVTNGTIAVSMPRGYRGRLLVGVDGNKVQLQTVYVPPGTMIFVR